MTFCFAARRIVDLTVRRFFRFAAHGGIGMASIFFVLVALSPGQAAADETLVAYRFSHGGLTRRYFVALPKPSNTPAGVIIGLHASGSRAQRFARYTALHKVATQQGFLVFFPDAVDGHWNDGLATVRLRAYTDQIDDVGFLLAMIAHYEGQADSRKLRSKRIFITGLANGGMMAHRMACEGAARVAAIAPVAAAMPVRLARRCRSTTPISILAINGTNDPLVPWRGGEIRRGFQRLGDALSPLKTMRFWAEKNGCDTTASTKDLPSTGSAAATQVTQFDYEFCPRAVTRFYKVDLGGATWPGARQVAPESQVGKTTDHIQASQLIVDFFQRQTARQKP